MRVVVKVGSSTLTHPNTGLLNIRRMESLCRVLSDIKNEGNELIGKQSLFIVFLFLQ